MNAFDLSQAKPAREYVQLIKQGVLTSESLVRHYLDVIKQTDEKIRRLGSCGPESMPWIKLVLWMKFGDAGSLREFFTASQWVLRTLLIQLISPPRWAVLSLPGRQPESDAAIVEKLKEAGAVILGKTVCTEFAYMHASATRNPCIISVIVQAGPPAALLRR